MLYTVSNNSISLINTLYFVTHQEKNLTAIQETRNMQVDV